MPLKLTHSQLLEGLKCESQTEKQRKSKELGHTPQLAALQRGRGACQSSEMGLGRSDKLYSLTRTCTKLTPSGQCIVEALLVLGRATGNSDTQDSPRPELGGSHHLPPYSILYASSRGPHPNGLFVPRLPSGNPEIATTRTSTTLRAHNFLCRPLIAMRSKAKLQPSLGAFQWYVACCLHVRESGPDFQWSGVKLLI